MVLTCRVTESGALLEQGGGPTPSWGAVSPMAEPFSTPWKLSGGPGQLEWDPLFPWSCMPLSGKGDNGIPKGRESRGGHPQLTV